MHLIFLGAKEMSTFFLCDTKIKFWYVAWLSFPETGLADDPNVTKEKSWQTYPKTAIFPRLKVQKTLFFLPIHKIVKVSKSELASRSA